MNTALVEKALRFRWLIFLVLALAYLFVYFHRLSLSVVANDLIKDFQTTGSVMGFLGSIYFYCYAAMQLPAGLLSDSLGPRKSVTIFLIIASAGSIIFGFARTIQMAFAGRILVGLGVSMVFIPTMKIFSQWFRAHEFAFMTGILNAVGGIGVFVATWVLALMTLTFGWRLSFELIGGFTFILVVLVWLVVRDRPADKGWPSITQIDHGGEGASPVPKQIPLLEGARRVVSEKHFWPVAIWFFFDCGIFFGFGALWGGPYLMDVYGMTRAEAGTILSMIAWGMIVGSPPLGLLSDKLLKSRKKPLIACASTLFAVFLFLNIFPAGLPHAVLGVLFFIFPYPRRRSSSSGLPPPKNFSPLKSPVLQPVRSTSFPFWAGPFSCRYSVGCWICIQNPLAEDILWKPIRIFFWSSSALQLYRCSARFS